MVAFAGNCIVCYTKLGQPHGKGGRRNASSKRKGSSSSFGPAEQPFPLRKQLFSFTSDRATGELEVEKNTLSVFLLLHVLKIPREVCADLLRGGNPCVWARTCPRCLEWVKDAKSDFLKLQKLTAHLNVLKDNLINTFYQSYDTLDCVDDIDEINNGPESASQICDFVRKMFYVRSEEKG